MNFRPARDGSSNSNGRVSKWMPASEKPEVKTRTTRSWRCPIFLKWTMLWIGNASSDWWWCWDRWRKIGIENRAIEPVFGLRAELPNRSVWRRQNERSDHSIGSAAFSNENTRLFLSITEIQHTLYDLQISRRAQ